MREGRRRSGRHACLAASALFAVLAVAAPARAQDEDTVPPPEVWRGAASANVASFEINREALLPVEGLFRFIALHGESVYETDRQTARASIFYPGEGLLQGPNLACGTFGAQFPPQFKPVLDACTTYDYPLTAKADASAPDRSTAGSLALGKPTDAVSTTANGARAHAAPDGANTTSTLHDLRVLGLPGIGAVSLIPLEQLTLDPTVLTIGSATSHTEQRIDHGGLVVSAESFLSGIKVLGGLIRIGSIRSTSTITDDAAGKRSSHATLEVGAVTVGGLPAAITNEGLVVGSPAGNLGPLQQQLQNALDQLLAALQVKVSVLPTVQTLDDGRGQAVASAGGVLVEITLNADGAPTVPGPRGDIDLNGAYVGTILLGNSGASGAATNFAPEDPAPTDTVPPAAGGGGGDGPFDPGASGIVGADGGSNLTPPSTGGIDRRPTTVSRPPDLIRRLTDPFGGRLGLVYLAFMFCVLGLAVVPRLTLPARLPAARS